MQRMLDDVEMEMTEYQQMKQHQHYQSYQKDFRHSTTTAYTCQTFNQHYSTHQYSQAQQYLSNLHR
eukprot:5870734-Amphidinium_carterae.1